MQVCLRWLAQLLPAAVDIDDLAATLTDIGLEVEGVAPAGPPLPDVVVGRVRSARKVRGTRLQACVVDAGPRGSHEVVCGAPNVRRGLRSALALPGALLPEVTVATREIQGVVSAGMLCSAAELGLGDTADTIVELGRSRPGVEVARLLELGDTVYDLAVTPNRGDWLSMLGIARELAAKTGHRLRAPRAPRLKPQGEAFAASIDPEVAKLCPKFTCLPLSGVDATAPTPPLIAQRLRSCGVRPISVIVDLTNYVMLELGQPLHAFDRARLAGGLHVRLASADERLVLLDGTRARLSDRYLVVADDAGPQALAGVMGGLDSGVTAGTTEVVLEAAHFAPAIVRGRTRELNISSEAAFRFERGVDPAMCETAIATTARLIMRHCGGSCGQLTVAGATPAPAAPIALAAGKVERLTGMAVPASQCGSSLRALGFAVKRARGAITAAAPSWRFDIERQEDLVEEIVRLGGYASLPTTLPLLDGQFVPAPERLASDALLRDRLASEGFQEIVTYAFVNPAWEADLYGNDKPPTLANPVAEDLSAMRSGLLGGLLDRAIFNQHRRQTSLRLFEIGRCFAPDGRQPVQLAALGWGSVETDSWLGGGHAFDFYDAKGALERLLPGARLDFEPLAGLPALHPGKAARVTLDGEPLGVVGELHPALVKRAGYEIAPTPAVFELDLTRLFELPHMRTTTPLSRFPLVRRDLAVLVDDAVRAGQLVESVRYRIATEDHIELARVFVFDSFAGGELPAGKRSVGLRIELRGKNANLTEQQISQIVDAAAQQLRDDHQAALRQ